MQVKIKVETMAMHRDYQDNDKKMWGTVYEQTVEIAEDQRQVADFIKSITRVVNQ